MSLQTIAAAALTLALATGGASLAQVRLMAQLNGASEVPSNDSAGHGELNAQLDTATHVLTYRAVYSGLTGPATMAHFHGPAAVGVNGPVVVPVISAASPIKGEATLTDAQMADFQAGKLYFNVHTQAHPDGEIRGQVMTAP